MNLRSAMKNESATLGSATAWKPEDGAKYDLVEIRSGHVFAWRTADNQGSQYLCCVICRRPHHEIFPRTPTNQPDNSPANGDCSPASCSADDLANGLRHAANDHPCCKSTLIASADMIDRLHQGIREFWSLAQFDWDTMPEPSRLKFREVVEEMANELLEPNAEVCQPSDEKRS